MDSNGGTVCGGSGDDDDDVDDVGCRNGKEGGDERRALGRPSVIRSPYGSTTGVW